jgi:hypothetical protein
MLQMIETLKGIYWSIKRHNGMSITIGAFADMDHLQDFYDMVAHPALLVPQNISVDGNTILTYFPNLMEAAPDEFNATPFAKAHTIPFGKIQPRVA